MDICTSGTQRRGDRAVGPYDYIICGETSEKVVCSIGSAWIRAEAAFKNVVTAKFGALKGSEWMGTRSVFLWEPGFPVMNRRIARRVSSLIWVVQGKTLAVVGGNCLQGHGGPIHRRQVLGGQRDFQLGGDKRL